MGLCRGGGICAGWLLQHASCAELLHLRSPGCVPGLLPSGVIQPAIYYTIFPIVEAVHWRSSEIDIESTQCWPHEAPARHFLEPAQLSPAPM